MKPHKHDWHCGDLDYELRGKRMGRLNPDRVPLSKQAQGIPLIFIKTEMLKKILFGMARLHISRILKENKEIPMPYLFRVDHDGRIFNVLIRKIKVCSICGAVKELKSKEVIKI